MNPAQRKAVQDIVLLDRARRIINDGVEACMEEGPTEELRLLSNRLYDESVKATAHLVKVFRPGAVGKAPRPPPTPVPS